MIGSANAAVMETADLGLDVVSLRADFPILGQTVHGKPLVYFDNVATI